MIYTLTLNPAIDYRLHSQSISPGKTNRSSKELLSFGGKGINVSKILTSLGIENTALGFCAGFTGKALADHLSEKGIRHDLVMLENGNTRINVKLCTDEDLETEINAAGPKVCKKELDTLFDKIKNTLSDKDILVMSGSVPAGVCDTVYADIMKTLSGKNIRFAVDATGSLLKNTLPLKPFLIKPNLDELSGLEGKTLETADEIIGAAKKLSAAGAMNVLVSLGKDGAMLLDETGRVHTICAHKGNVINTVGSGDSMVAGFLAGVEKGYEYALKLGNAAGGASAFSQELAEKNDIFSLMEN